MGQVFALQIKIGRVHVKVAQAVLNPKVNQVSQREVGGVVNSVTSKLKLAPDLRTSIQSRQLHREQQSARREQVESNRVGKHPLESRVASAIARK